MNGTALRSEAFATQVVRVTVSLRHSGLPTRVDKFPVLSEADRAAHEEAVQNGGVSPIIMFPTQDSQIDVFVLPKLLMYWYGIPDQETGLNLATCVWQSRSHALAAHTRPKHIRAMRLAASSYASYELERWTLRKTVGSRGLEILPYDGRTAGQ